MNRDDVVKEEEMLSRLLKLRREEVSVPELRQARARRVVHDHWRGQLQRRRRNRWLSVAAAFAMVGLSALLVGRWIPEDASALGRVASVSGQLSLDGQGRDPVLLSTGSRGIDLFGATVLRTEPGSMSALDWQSGHSIRLAPDTRLELVDEDTLRLNRGAVYVDSGEIRRIAALEVITEYGVFREIGTRFMVTMDANRATVRVREGAVALDGSGPPVPAGERLTVNESGTVERGTVDVHGEDWNWTFAALGKLSLEGRTLDEFLRWMAAENGWELSYASPEIARRAARHTLSGALEGLGPHQALAAVLRTFGLRHAVEQGRLIISSDPGALSMLRDR